MLYSIGLNCFNFGYKMIILLFGLHLYNNILFTFVN
jgi:hypothetical protein